MSTANQGEAAHLVFPSPGETGFAAENGMTLYRAIVSITFDDDDLQEFANAIGIEVDRLKPHETLDGCLDNLEIGSPWVEQFFVDGQPTIARLSGGIQVEINEHEE